jgi:C4-dicarboxylate-specific signal transduction histidine kinase
MRNGPATLDCWIDVCPESATLVGQPSFRMNQRLQDELMAINQELAVLSRDRSRDEDDATVVVCIQDEGEGIPPEQLPRISELFQRATTTGPGLGVGLAVVRALVAAHGGSIIAASEGLGRGAVFTVRLPLAPHDPRA